MIIPPLLKKGSTIAIASSARFAEPALIEKSARLIEQQGFKVIIAPNVTQAHHRFAGDDATRAGVLQNLVDDETIDAIWFARGGYGTLRIIDSINWTNFLKHPKWIIGFSDMTLFHLKMQELTVASIHGCTFVQVEKFGLSHENVISVLEILLNQNKAFTFKTNKLNKKGSASGILTGGNLSLICNSIGTSTQIKTDNKILVLEDCDEYSYHYDRMLRQMKRSGLLKNLNGLIFGKSSIKPEPGEIDFGYSLEEIVLNICSEFTYPVCFDAPVGHDENNYALRLNTMYSLDVTDDFVRIAPK